MNESELGVAPLSLKRHERLWRLYSLLLELVMHEGRFVSERTNNFLLFASILFAGFLFVATQVNQAGMWVFTLKTALASLGVVMSIFHHIIIRHNLQARDFWREKLIQIENDPDFWYPARVEKDMNLNIIESGHKMVEARDQAGKLTRHLHPNALYGSWLPFLLGMLWLLALGWSITAQLSKTN